jgi:hypothetical protein
MNRKVKESIQKKTEHMVPDKWSEIHKEALYFMKPKNDNDNGKKYWKVKNSLVLVASVCIVFLSAVFISDIYITQDSGSDKPGEQNSISLEQKESNIPNVIGNPNKNAVYHNVDIAKITRKTTLGKVPFGFFFRDKITDLVKEDLNNMNNRIYWEEQEYTKDDIEADFQIAIKSPVLPDGNYTTKQYVLKDKFGKDIIGYQTVYYYFDKETLDFQSSYSLFYFSEHNFKWDDVKQIQNVNIVDKKINMEAFEESTNLNAKLPHIRRLIYLEDGVAIAIEAEADIVMEGSIIDAAKSLEKYNEVDKQLVNMMKSLIE